MVGAMTVDGVQLATARRDTGCEQQRAHPTTVIDPLSGNARLNAIPVVVTAG